MFAFVDQHVTRFGPTSIYRFVFRFCPATELSYPKFELMSSSPQSPETPPDSGVRKSILSSRALSALSRESSSASLASMSSTNSTMHGADGNTNNGGVLLSPALAIPDSQARDGFFDYNEEKTFRSVRTKMTHDLSRLG